MKKGGEALIYVWALEQENSRRGYKEGDPQDVLVPWVLQKKQPKKNKEKKRGKKSKAQTEETTTEGSQEEKKEEEEAVEENSKNEENNTKFRYYHLYKQGELEDNAKAAGGIIVDHGYERDNWYAIIQKP